MSIDFQNKKGFICDMDGVLYHGNRLLSGAVEFINWLQKNGETAVKDVGEESVRGQRLQGVLQIFLRRQVILVIDQYRRRGVSPGF